MTIHEPGWYPRPKQPLDSALLQCTEWTDLPRTANGRGIEQCCSIVVRHHHKSSAVIHARCSAGPSWLGVRCCRLERFFAWMTASAGIISVSRNGVPDGRARECYGGRTDRPDSSD